jgi:hypothetical protein
MKPLTRQFSLASSYIIPPSSASCSRTSACVFHLMPEAKFPAQNKTTGKKNTSLLFTMHFYGVPQTQLITQLTLHPTEYSVCVLRGLHYEHRPVCSYFNLCVCRAYTGHKFLRRLSKVKLRI